LKWTSTRGDGAHGYLYSLNSQALNLSQFISKTQQGSLERIIISIILHLTLTLKMLATDLLQDFVSSDPVRRLQPGYDVNRHQQRGQDNIDDGAASPEEEHVQNNVIWIYIAGMVVILFVVFGSFRLVQNYIISTGSDEFAIDHTVPQKPRKSTLDERKQAILELFETSQVTMVSKDHILVSGIRIRNLRQ
jgi:hypothetical protein